MPSQAYGNYAMGPSQMSFLFQSCLPPIFCYVGVCYVVCFLLSGPDVSSIFTNGAKLLGVASLQLFGLYQWQA